MGTVYLLREQPRTASNGVAMITDKIRELEATRAKLANLEQSIQSELKKELAGLPEKYGFDSAAAFIAAVRAASGGTHGRRGRVGRTASAPRKRRKRAVVTDEMRAQVKKLVGDGKTGAEIAKTVGVSLPTVQNIKKALGLVRKR